MNKTPIKSIATVSLLALALAGCGTTSLGGTAKTSAIGVVGHSETQGLDPIGASAYWGTRYDANPADPKVAAAYSQALRKIENPTEALQVSQQANVRVGDNPDVLLELGKAFIANNRPHEALRPIERAIELGKGGEWEAYSSYGVALDMIGEHKLARAQYDYALTLSPGQPQVMNNKALSLALSGRKLDAEMTLREASTGPGATARMRQNLALILALSGEKSEAERLARSDLPPAVASGNVAYFHSLVSQSGTWTDLEAAVDVELPAFSEDTIGTADLPPMTAKSAAEVQEETPPAFVPVTSAPAAPATDEMPQAPVLLHRPVQ